MSSDPIKNILRILYDDLTSGVYSILKSVKKIQRPDLERKLKEQNYEYQNYYYVNPQSYQMGQQMIGPQYYPPYIIPQNTLEDSLNII